MDHQRLQNLHLNQPLNPIARVILQGVHDDNSPFSKLNGIPHVLQKIWQYLLATMKQHIKFEPSWLGHPWDQPGPKPSMGVCGFLECEGIRISGIQYFTTFAFIL